MDEFMDVILGAIREHGARAVRVFPPASQVLIQFADRLAIEVVGEYITTLLAHAREISNDTYLKSTAASFRVAWKMVDAIMDVANQRKDSDVDTHKAEDVVCDFFVLNSHCARLTRFDRYRMFEANMDEYLDEEVESVKLAFDAICKGWDREVSNTPVCLDPHSAFIQASASTPTAADGTRQFISSQNPALLKRNVLASFTNILLLPVTIVPRTVGVVGGALMTGGSAAVQGIQMLNPQRWVTGAGGTAAAARPNGYSKNFQESALFEEDEEDYVPTLNGARAKKSGAPTILAPYRARSHSPCLQFPFRSSSSRPRRPSLRHQASRPPPPAARPRTTRASSTCCSPLMSRWKLSTRTASR
jgi:recyclin-1